MKQNSKQRFILISLLAVVLLGGCDLGNGLPKTDVSFNVELNPITLSKAKESVNVNDFIFVLRAEDGNLVDSSLVSQMAESMQLSPGVYTAKVYSANFTVPAFDMPLYMAENEFEVTGQRAMTVEMVCKLKNAGVQVFFTADYAAAHQWKEYFITIADSSLDSLIFTPDMKDSWGYFNPGPVRLRVYSNGVCEGSIYQTLVAQSKTLVTVSAQSVVMAPVMSNISIDNTVVDHSISWQVGAKDPQLGESLATAMSLEELDEYFKLLVGRKVWVKGYVVGGKISSGKVTFGTEGASQAHLALAASPAETESSNCFSLELPSSSQAREILCLAYNPSVLGTLVYVKATVSQAYLGLRGLKSPTDVVL